MDLIPNRSFKEILIFLLNKAFNFLRKLFIYGYNVYGWYWLYKIVSTPKLQFDGENYVLWFFAMMAQFFFEVDVRNANKDVDVRKYFEHYFKKQKK